MDRKSIVGQIQEILGDDPEDIDYRDYCQEELRILDKANNAIIGIDDRIEALTLDEAEEAGVLMALVCAMSRVIENHKDHNSLCSLALALGASRLVNSALQRLKEKGKL